MPDLIGHLELAEGSPSMPHFHQFLQLMEVFVVPPDGKDLTHLKFGTQYIGVM